MRTKVENRFFINWIYSLLILLVVLSNVFSYKLEIFFKLRPNISNLNSTQIHFIDVGQGDAIAIKFFNGKTMLIDSGTREYRNKLTYYLDNMIVDNSKTIDYLILTHPDIDHSGNMEFIVNNYNVVKFIRPQIFELYENKIPNCENPTYRNLIQTLLRKNINVEFAKDQIFNFGSTRITMLTVLEMFDDLSELSTNEFSPIIIVEENNNKVMLTGDITEDVEEKLIQKYSNEILDIDILKLAHHGSKYSNTNEFLNVTSPDYVVASVGENSYGHPANDTITRILEYDKNNSTSLYDNFLNTKDNGNIIFTLNKNVNVDLIPNIDDYNFVDYYIYTIITTLILLYFLCLPYYKALRKDLRFYIQNKKFIKLKDNQK